MIRDLLGRDVGASDCLLGAALVGGLHLSLKPRLMSRQDWLQMQRADLVMIDSDGALWRVAQGSRHELVKWCRERVVRVYASPGALVDALQRGHVIGLLPAIAPRVGVSWQSALSVSSASVTA